ncbi:MAG: FHA domain-containing protein [Gammaproteobacteria bacterium]|nr:MAG: FHA domain-containing protein [Gammaproteobacteria bacterium]
MPPADRTIFPSFWRAPPGASAARARRRRNCKARSRTFNIFPKPFHSSRILEPLMGKIVIKLNNSVVDHVELNQGDTRIGRKPGCEIHLDNLSVSGEHANIFTIGGDSFVQDLGSTNGTYVNGKKVAKHHLKSGDSVNIGKYTLMYLQDDVEAPSDYAKTVIITTPVQPEPIKSSAPATEKIVKQAPLGQAVIIALGGAGKRIELTKTVTNLGKGGRRAGTITRTADGYLLASGGDDHPKLNGRPVSGKQVKLRNGDIIEVAGTRLQFQLK